MKTIDRYILRSFFVNYLILGAALLSLIVMIDLILKLDEFSEGAEAVLGDSGLIATVQMIGMHYGPRLLLLFVYVAGLLPLGAAAFTLATLIRNRELVAMLAGGISLYRVAMPLLVAAALSNLLLFVDQQVFIPPLAHQLSQKASDLDEGLTKPLSFYFVPDSRGALFSGSSFDTAQQTMTGVSILIRGDEQRARSHIYADSARWDASRRGWRLVSGRLVTHDVDRATLGEPIAQTQPIDFIATDLDPTTLVARYRARYRQMLSLGQLASLIDKPHLVDTDELTRILHGRFSLIVINMLILAMGLPYFLMRHPKNLLNQTVKMLMICLPAWGGGFLMLLAGPPGLPPALIAWLPVAIYLPVAFYLMDRLET